MAERTPMVKVGSYWRELPAGDTVAGASGGSATLFGYSNGQSVTAGTATVITGLSVTVEDDTFYAVDVWIAIDTTSASFGEISTTGTATFSGLLATEVLSSSGGINATSRPASFTWTGDTPPEDCIHFFGTIQTTGAGTIILNALSINSPDAFVIDEARMTLTPIGTV